MSDMWVGLCAEEHRDAVRDALSVLHAGSSLSYVGSAFELRARVQDSPCPIGAVVGPLDDGVSPVNTAAALVRDGMATEVALAAVSIPDGLAMRAHKAGINELIDLSKITGSGLDDLDEPSLPDDEVPTMLWGLPTLRQATSQALAEVDSLHSTGGKWLEEDPYDDMPKTKLIVPTSGLASSESQPSPVVSSSPVRLSVGRGSKAVHNASPVIVLASGRGGVGKTSLVATMAMAAQRWGMRVAVCDLDLWFGNLYSCFGASGPADLYGLLGSENDARALMDGGAEVAPGITLWGSCAVPEQSESTYGMVQELLGVLSANHDVVLVDTSTTVTDAVAQAMQQCDRLVLTVDGREGTSVAQTRLAALAVRLGIARTRIVRLANRCGPRGRGEPAINRADVGLETARCIRVLEGGAEVSDCMGEGKVAELFDMGSRFAESAATAMAQLLSELGRLPQNREAKEAYERRNERPRWGFGRRREAM